MSTKTEKAATEEPKASAQAEPDPHDHAAFVGRTFKRTGREYPDRVAYTVDDVVQLRHDGYVPKPLPKADTE